MTWRTVLLALPILAFGWTTVGAQTITIEVTAPPDGAAVDRQELVMGMVSDPSAVVHLLIRPLANGDYYVQPQPTVNPIDGSWQIGGYFGDPDTSSGTLFEIVAVANPDVPLRRGDRLPALPASDAHSPPISVTRR